jgi:hypothetical protein
VAEARGQFFTAAYNSIFNLVDHNHVFHKSIAKLIKITQNNLSSYNLYSDRLCGLVVRVPGYKSRGPGVVFPALPNFMRSSGYGTGSTQPHEYN